MVGAETIISATTTAPEACQDKWAVLRLAEASEVVVPMFVSSAPVMV